MQKEFLSKSPDDTKKIAGDIIKYLLGNCDLKKEPHLIFLNGNLGAGKTTFVKGVLEYFKVNIERGISPTFVIIKRYPVSNDKIENIFHIDAYRSNSVDDLNNLGFEYILKNKKNLILLEWPENVKGFNPNNAVVIKIDYVENINDRKIILEL